MAFLSAVQWWEDWQLHILVLGSLTIQCYLSVFASARKRNIHPLFRFSIWLAFLGGDALAIYAIAILFNRQRKLWYNSVSGNHDLEVVWGSIMLIHLGGQVNISAYNIEDNELWTRHILTTVSQVVVVLYVFCMSWSSSADKRLLAAAILLFIMAIFKCFDKPLALKRASFNSLVTAFRPAPRTNTAKSEIELEEYIQEAWIFVQRNKNPQPLDSDDSRSSHSKELSIPDKLFVDYAYVFDDRLTKLKSFWLLDEKTIYDALRLGLSETFNLIYCKIHAIDTKNRRTSRGNIVSMLIPVFNLLFPIVPISLFHSSHKKAYKGTDIMVTYILLYITYFLEISSLFIFCLFILESSGGIAQCNLVGLLAWNRRHTRLMCITEFFQCKGLLDTYFGMRPCHLSEDITMLVRQHVKAGWMSYITDIESYWRFSDSRGQWALERNGGEEILQWIIEKPFDESIILWHVATEFCFHMVTSHDFQYARMCREISNYMTHLLFSNPEMLLPGSRRNLFRVAYDELVVILEGDDDPLPLDERELVLKIINKAELPQGFIQDSWILAQELMRFGYYNRMWEVIIGVWLEMLCYSAGRCRGYLHAKSLCSGGEFLSYVSLLMSHGGLETYAERQQRVQLRLPKEARQHIVRVKAMKKEIEEAARNMERRIMERTATVASAEVQVVVS